MSKQRREELTGARAALAKDIEKLDQRLIETAAKSTEEPTLGEQHATFRARIHAISVKMTQRVSGIRREAERARRALVDSSIIDAVLEDQNENK